MKIILVLLMLGALLLAPTALPAEEPPAPLLVEAVMGPGTAVVTWTPPVLPPEDLLDATYRVYGYVGGSAELLTTEESIAVGAVVSSGYETYGVSVVLHGVESIQVKACVTVTSSPPFVALHC